MEGLQGSVGWGPAVEVLRFLSGRVSMAGPAAGTGRLVGLGDSTTSVVRGHSQAAVFLSGWVVSSPGNPSRPLMGH